MATLHGSLALAQRMDLGEIRFCRLAARAGEPGGADALEAGGGLALCGAPGLPFNKVLGLGLGATVSDRDLDAIDEFYDRHGVPSQVELCPLAAPGLAARLAARGYAPQGFENQLARVLDGADDAEPPAPGASSTLAVAPTASAGDDEHWIDVIAHGFAAGDQLAAHDVVLAQGDLRAPMRAFQHPSFSPLSRAIRRRACRRRSRLRHRRRIGPHRHRHRARPSRPRRAARRHRPHAARLGGRADLAMATTEPGSQSQRAFERFGFRVIYTRAVFIRPFA